MSAILTGRQGVLKPREDRSAWGVGAIPTGRQGVLESLRASLLSDFCLIGLRLWTGWAFGPLLLGGFMLEMASRPCSSFVIVDFCLIRLRLWTGVCQAPDEA